MVTKKFKHTEIGEIPDGWETIKLSEIAVVNGEVIDNTFAYQEIEYIDISSISQGIVSEIEKIHLKEAPSRAQRIVRKNDILLSTVRPNLKHFAFMKNVKPNTIASTGFAVITPKKINPQFLYYYLSTDRYTNYLSAIAESHTSAYPACNPDVIENSLIPYPPCDEQRAIAKILSDLDEMIELNRQMNKTLESIAQAIFKHWFVNFEFPDKNGKPYRSSGGPLVYDEEYGMARPQLWSVVPLPEVCRIVDCLHSRKSDRTNAGRYLLQVYNIGEYHTLDLSDKYFVSESDYTEWTRNIEVKEGDCIITNAGKVGAIAQIPHGFKGGIGRNITAIRPEKIPPSYLLQYLISTHGNREVFRNTDQGTIFSSLNVKGIRKIRVLMPTIDVVVAYEKNARALRLKIEENVFVNSTLTTIRDSLLPKLMSGKIRIASD